MSRNLDVLAIKTKDFALRIIKLSHYLKDKKREFEFSHQVIRSGTSIGANIAEAAYAQSRADFVSKFQIAAKECAETKYWLELLLHSHIIDKDAYESINGDCEVILKILTSSIVTARRHLGYACEPSVLYQSNNLSDTEIYAESDSDTREIEFDYWKIIEDSYNPQQNP